MVYSNKRTVCEATFSHFKSFHVTVMLQLLKPAPEETERMIIPPNNCPQPDSVRLLGCVQLGSTAVNIDESVVLTVSELQLLRSRVS